MTGTQEYEMKFQKRIDNIIQNNESYLLSYYNFIGMNKTIRTKYLYVNSVYLFIKQYGKKINELTMDDFTKYISEIYKNKSSSYAIVVYAALKLFGRYLLASRNLSYNPMAEVDRPRYVDTMQTKEKREKGVLEQTEISLYKQNIINGVGSNQAINRQKRYKSRDLLIVSIFLNTGIRCSALMKIDLQDIDIDSLTLTVSDKGNKINSYVLNQSIVPYIIEWLNDRKNILNGLDCDALFISNQRTRMEQSSIYRVVNKYANNIKGKHITPHKLRATYGSQIYNETKDIYFTQQCMKHSNPKTTELYIRGNVKNTDTASSIMSKLFN